MDPQRRLTDDRIGPGTGDQPLLRDGLTGTLDESNEDVERPAAEMQRHSIPEQHALCRYQAKGSEGDVSIIHRRLVLQTDDHITNNPRKRLRDRRRGKACRLDL